MVPILEIAKEALQCIPSVISFKTESWSDGRVAVVQSYVVSLEAEIDIVAHWL